jgi:hypothetical protein
VYLLVRDSSFPHPVEDPAVRRARHFPSLLSTLTLTDHRRALVGFLRAHGIEAVEVAPGKLEARTRRHVPVAVTGHAGRLEELTLYPT